MHAGELYIWEWYNMDKLSFMYVNQIYTYNISSIKQYIATQRGNVKHIGKLYYNYVLLYGNPRSAYYNIFKIKSKNYIEGHV